MKANGQRLYGGESTSEGLFYLDTSRCWRSRQRWQGL